MSNEHDLGWQNCMAEKVAPLYAAIESALIELEDHQIGPAWVVLLMKSLKDALREADK